MFALMIFLGACEDDKNIQEPEPQVRPVKFYEVSFTNANRISKYPAKISAKNTSQLSFQVSGQIKSLSLTESQQVTKGQVIAKLDDSDYRNNYNAIKAQYDNASSEFARIEKLAEKGAVSKNDIENKRSQVKVYKAQTEVAKKALDDTVLKAPYSGTVSSVAVEKFKNIQALETIATIISEKALEASVNIPGSILSKSPDNKLIKAELTFDTIPDLVLPATFKEISLAADSTTQTYQVKFQFDAPTESLILPGMNGTMIIKSSNNHKNSINDVQIPISAVQNDAINTYVWVVDLNKMTVSKRNIEVSSKVGLMLTVISGLENKETIAAAGGAYLAEGMKVKQWNDQ